MTWSLESAFKHSSKPEEKLGKEIQGDKGMFEISRYRESTVAAKQPKASGCEEKRKKKPSSSRAREFEIGTMRLHKRHKKVTDLFLLTCFGFISRQICCVYLLHRRTPHLSDNLQRSEQLYFYAVCIHDKFFIRFS